MRNPRYRLAVFATVWALIFSAGFTPASAANQTAPQTNQRVIAHGVDSFDGTNMMWQVVQRSAGTDQNAGPATTSTGFVLASDGSLTISDSSTKRGDYVSPGAAAFRPQGSSQLVVGSGGDTAYTEIALSAESLGGDYTSNGIQTPTGDRAVELTSGTLASGANSTYTPGNEYAYVLHVTSGSVNLVDDENTTFELADGKSITVTGAVELSSSGDASYVIAAIGPEVTVPPFAGGSSGDTGTLTIKQLDCPAGTDPAADASSCAASEEPWPVNIHPSGHDDSNADLNIPEDGFNDNSSWTWTETSEGIWNITPASAEGTDLQIVVTGAEEAEGTYDAQVNAGEETVVTIYIVGERPSGDGTFAMSVLKCDPVPMEPLGPVMDGCTQGTDGTPNFVMFRVNDKSVEFDQSDLTLSDDGIYRMTGVPAGMYTLIFEVPEEGDLRVSSDFPRAGGVLSYTVSIGSDYETNMIVAVGPSGYVPEGTATFSYFVCTAPSDDPVNDANCVSTPLPGSVVLTNNDGSGATIDSASGAIDGQGNSTVTLAPGDYSVSVNFTPQGEVSAPATVTINQNEGASVLVVDVVPAGPVGTPPQ